MRTLWYITGIITIILTTMFGIPLVRGSTNGALMPKRVAQEIVVQPQSRQRQLLIEGDITAKFQQLVSAAFDTRIQRVHVNEGQQVRRGDILVTLAPADIDVKIRLAEIALIKAKENLRNLKNWQQSKEVKQAQRSLYHARQQFRQLTEQAKATTRLYAEGIVPRAEIETDQQAVTDQADVVANAQEEYESVLDQGNRQKIYIAGLELKNMQVAYNKLMIMRDGNIIRSPISGVVEGIKESSSPSTNVFTFPSIGQKVTTGSPLFMLKSTEDLIIKAKVNEVEAADLFVGQTAIVTSDAAPGLTWEARISNIARKAVRNSLGHDLYPQIFIEAALKETPKEMFSLLRPGGAVFLSINISSKQGAIMIPPEALQFHTQQTFVKIKMPNGLFQTRPVQAGAHYAGLVQVLEGLQVGDTVILSSK